MKNLFLTIALFLGLGLSCPQAVAATDTDISSVGNTIYVTATEAKPGAEITLSVKMKNAITVTGYQVDILLPEGLSFVTSEGYADASISAERLATTRSHTFDAEFQTDGALRLLCYSSKNTPFSNNDGEVAVVKIKVGDNVADLLSVRLKEIVLTEASGKTVEASDVYFSVKVSAENYDSNYDVNKDGKIDVQDVTSLVDYILNH